MAKHYLGQLVLQHLLGRADVGEEDMEEVPGGLGIDLLLAEVNVSHLDGLGWGQAQHLFRMDAAFKDLCENFPSAWHQFFT